MPPIDLFKAFHGLEITQQHLLSFALNAALLLLAIPVSRLASNALLHLLMRTARLLPKGLAAQLAAHTPAPLRGLLLLIALNIALVLTTIPDLWTDRLRHVLYPGVIAMLGWLMTAMVRAGAAWLSEHYAWKDRDNNLSARRISTQLRVFTNTIIFLVVLLTAIGIIMTVPSLRNVGLSLFASAGVAGLVIGMAARPALANLIAGMQLALTQPIRLDDQVLVEGETGRVEEITASYVVIRIWDKRQLIVPLSYFVEQPFQNWTHTGTELLGTVFFYLDYTAPLPLEAIRTEMMRIVSASPHWDGATCILHLTDISREGVAELRALVSAANSSKLWDLRCELREKLIDFLQREYPYCLPKRRVEGERGEKNSLQG